MKFKNIENFPEILEKSKEKPLFIFKNSSTCCGSEKAKTQIEMYLKGEIVFDVYMLTVQGERELSNEIENELDIKHETPQLIFLKQGKPEFVLNHSEITLQNIEENLR